MAEVCLTLEQWKLILKWYQKFKNVYEVQRQWGCKFATETLAELTISRICDKFENDGTVQDEYKQ